MAFRQIGIPARKVIDRIRQQRVDLLLPQTGSETSAEFSEAGGAATPSALGIGAGRREESDDPQRRGGGSAHSNNKGPQVKQFGPVVAAEGRGPAQGEGDFPSVFGGGNACMRGPTMLPRGEFDALPIVGTLMHVIEGGHASSPSLAARRRPRLFVVGSDGWPA